MVLSRFSSKNTLLWHKGLLEMATQKLVRLHYASKPLSRSLRNFFFGNIHYERTRPYVRFFISRLDLEISFSCDRFLTTILGQKMQRQSEIANFLPKNPLNCIMRQNYSVDRCETFFPGNIDCQTTQMYVRFFI